MTIFAAVLALAAVAAFIVAKVARSDVRLQLRLTCVLYLIMAAATLSEVARPGVTLAVTTLGPALLTLAVLTRRGMAPAPAISAIVLASVALAGIVAAVTGIVLIAVIPQFLCLGVMLARQRPIGRAGIYRALSALTLAAAAASLLVADRMAAVGVLLFSASGLIAGAIALASDVGVEQRPRRGKRFAVGR